MKIVFNVLVFSFILTNGIAQVVESRLQVSPRHIEQSLQAEVIPQNVKSNAPNETSISASASGQANAIQSIEIGTKIDLTALQLKDVMQNQSSYLNEFMRPNGLIVMFSCNTCPYVIKSQDRTREVIKLAKLHNVGIVILNSNEAQRGDVDGEEAMLKYGKEHDYHNYLVDKNSTVANVMGATKTPEIFYFNNNNVLIYKGAMDDNPANPQEAKVKFLEEAMKATSSNTAIKTTTSKSIGCSIKRLK